MFLPLGIRIFRRVQDGNQKKKHSFQIKPMYCIHPKAFTGLVKGVNVLPSSLRSAATGLGKVSIDVRGGLRR